ncbi:MAG: flagellar basal body-associated FliL family protein [Magnetovibrio sp.]|nr:flagellar basal body-associated FliL family protein [Magnetovibrio sp.]
MADDDEGEGEIENTEEPSGGGLLKRVIKIFLLLVIMAASGGAYLFFTAEPEIDPADDEEFAEVQVEEAQAIYTGLEPTFVVNFVYKDTLRYLQTSIAIMARDDFIINQVEVHMPAIRDRLLMILSNKTYAQLSGPAQREKLRENILIEIRKIVGISESGHSVETVYFTGFVMQ